jgi:hypothetical protein
MASGLGVAPANGQSPAGMAMDPAPGDGPSRSEPPLLAIDAHVCGLHFYSGDLRRQVIAHHYCSHFSKDVLQCVIYDSDRKNARLVGIEYIVSAELFAGLPAEEKKLWHSHVYEVKSGQLTAPRISGTAEKGLMKDLIGTYGKTWYTWQADRDEQVPLGIPQLMMAFVADGQANPRLLADRDREQGVSSAEKKKDRADLVAPAIQPGADGWQKGEAIQLETKTVKMAGAP